jgi:hypothetical protein
MVLEGEVDEVVYIDEATRGRDRQVVFGKKGPVDRFIFAQLFRASRLYPKSMFLFDNGKSLLDLS